MANYRLYRLDGAGKITSAEWLEADGAEAAVERVRTMDLGIACEIWDRHTLIARVDPRSPSEGGADNP